MSAADEAWQEWERRNWPMGNSGSGAARASFMAGYRIGAKAQWDASVADEFAARRAAAVAPRETKD